MNRARTTLIVAGLVVFVSVSAWLVRGKEHILESGRKVLLRIEQRDPRSIFQGDYMWLRYPLAREIEAYLPHDDPPSRGTAILRLDEDDVATLSRVLTNATSSDEGSKPLDAREQRLRFRVYSDRMITVRFASQDYFFEEGLGEVFAKARYAELRVDSVGNALLVALCDENLARLGT
ncbi:MAG: GDYXXLXY domain-containing protein [Planctomycetes bacterium]|nr:GDYXXLXY domain-containing protein [Planctomycetota bacterium]